MKQTAKKQQLPKFITKARKTKGKANSDVVRQIGDRGTPQLSRHHRLSKEVRERTANGQPRTYGAKVMDQLPIDRYYDRHELAPRQTDPQGLRNAALYQAAKRLREDFYASGLMQRGVTSFERVPSGSMAPDKAATMHVASLQAFNKAIRAIAPSLRPILRHVVCYDGTARDWAIENRDNPNGGLAMLRAALTDLAHYYRILVSK